MVKIPCYDVNGIRMDSLIGVYGMQQVALGCVSVSIRWNTNSCNHNNGKLPRQIEEPVSSGRTVTAYDVSIGAPVVIYVDTEPTTLDPTGILSCFYDMTHPYLALLNTGLLPS